MEAPRTAVVWLRHKKDESSQAYIRMSHDASTALKTLKETPAPTEQGKLLELYQQMQNYIPDLNKLTTWPLESLMDARETARLRHERDHTRTELEATRKDLTDARAIM